MKTIHTLLIIVFVALLGVLGYSAEGFFGMSPGTMVQLASTRAEIPVYVVRAPRRYDVGNTVLIIILIVGALAFMLGALFSKSR